MIAIYYVINSWARGQRSVTIECSNPLWCFNRVTASFSEPFLPPNMTHDPTVEASCYLPVELLATCCLCILMSAISFENLFNGLPDTVQLSTRDTESPTRLEYGRHQATPDRIRTSRPWHR